MFNKKTESEELNSKPLILQNYTYIAIANKNDFDLEIFKSKVANIAKKLL